MNKSFWLCIYSSLLYYFQIRFIIKKRDSHVAHNDGRNTMTSIHTLNKCRKKIIDRRTKDHKNCICAI